MILQKILTYIKKRRNIKYIDEYEILQQIKNITSKLDNKLIHLHKQLLKQARTTKEFNHHKRQILMLRRNNK